MTIEEAIKQKKPFRNPYERAIVNLMYTSNHAIARIKEAMHPYKITNQQYNVLRILKGATRPLSTSMIRERLLDKMADTSRLVDRMEQKGLVVKSQCPNDKRLVDVEISARGDALLAEINMQVEPINNNILNLSLEEIQQLNMLLDKARG